MLQNYKGYAVGTAIGAAMMLSCVSSGFAAPRDRGGYSDVPQGSENLYDYVPGAGAASSYNRGNAFAPPDPASCGGFHC